MKVILVRHADYNLVTGNNPGLSESGEDQARRLANVIKQCLTDTGIHTIWSSPANRAVETARILSNTLGIKFDLLHEKLWSDYAHAFDFAWLKQMIEEYSEVKPQCDVLIIVSHLEYVQQFPAYIGLYENNAHYACGIIMEWPVGHISGEPFLWAPINWYDGQ